MPLSYDEFVDKAASQTLTLGEAIDYAMSKPNISENHLKQVRALRTALTQGKLGISADIPLAEMRKEENYSRLFKSVNKSSNKLGNFQALELNIRPVLEESGVLNITMPGPGGKGQIKVYPLITGGKGSGSLTGGAQRTELAGERPMRDLITQNDVEKLYSEAIPEIRAGFGDVAADVALYHKATFQRPEQILGDSAITKSDVSITDEYVTIRGVTKGKKTRPTVKYPVGSEMADLILRNYESTQSDKLFDIAPKVYDDAYRAAISPRLVAGFEEALPLVDAKDPSKGVVSTPSATRSFMVKIVTDELGYPDDVAEAMMGHTDSSILSKNYRGLKPLEGMGKIVDSLLVGVREGFAGFGDDASSFTSVLTEEERRDVAKAQVAEAKAKTEGYLSEALQKQRERVAYFQSEEGQKLLEGEQSLAKQAIERKLDLQAFEAEKKAQMKAASAPTVEIKPVVLPDDVKANVPAFLDFLNNMKGKGQAVVAGLSAGLGALGLAGIATEAEAAYSEEMGRSGSPLRAVGAGAARGTYEALEPLPVGFIRPQPAGGPESSLMTPEERIRQEKVIGEQMGRIRQFETKMGPGISGPIPSQQRGLVDDQMTRLLQGE